MKLNVDNFIRSCEAKIGRIHYIIDDDLMVRTERAGVYSHSYLHMYHTIKWWSVFNRNGTLEMLLYIENPKKKYDWKEWNRRRKFFCEVYECLEKGD